MLFGDTRLTGHFWVFSSLVFTLLMKNVWIRLENDNYMEILILTHYTAFCIWTSRLHCKMESLTEAYSLSWPKMWFLITPLGTTPLPPTQIESFPTFHPSTTSQIINFSPECLRKQRIWKKMWKLINTLFWLCFCKFCSWTVASPRPRSSCSSFGVRYSWDNGFFSNLLFADLKRDVQS